MGFFLCKRENTLKSLGSINVNDKVLNIILLKDGNLSCLTKSSIIIYNKEYKISDIISEEDNFHYYFTHTELLNGSIVTGCFTGEINIYKYKGKNQYEESAYSLFQTLKEHTNSIGKILEIDNKIISCSSDQTMKIWEIKNSNYICIKSIIINEGEYLGKSDIFKINENELVSISHGSKYIKFWDIKNSFNEITKIESNSESFNSICMINNNILILGGDKSLFIIDIITHQKINIIEIGYKIISMIALSNENILIGCKGKKGKHSLRQYKYVDKELLEGNCNEEAHNNEISGLIELKDGVIVSSSYDTTVKFWY